MCNRKLLGLVVLAVILGMGKSFLFAVVVVTRGFRSVSKREREREEGFRLRSSPRRVAGIQKSASIYRNNTPSSQGAQQTYTVTDGKKKGERVETGRYKGAGSFLRSVGAATAFWLIKPYRVVRCYRRFGRTYCIYMQSRTGTILIFKVLKKSYRQ
jgi:hypothetical protein